MRCEGDMRRMCVYHVRTYLNELRVDVERYILFPAKVVSGKSLLSLMSTRNIST
jgi:hypothetical protein